MNSIESLRLDFNSQVQELGNISNDKVSDDLIFVGSGDSYAAGLVAEFVTDHKCKCYSPSDLFNSKFMDNKTYCFISVTGRTKANIEIARRAKESGIKTVAITLDENSNLAQVCSKVIPLKISKVNTPTAGFSTFTANVVTCLQLLGVTLPNKFHYWHKKAVELSLSVSESVAVSNDLTHVLANNLLYPVALYTSFQMAEFFGSTFTAHKLEEFCHSPIFGLKKSHNLWILGQNEKIYSSRIEGLGVSTSYIELYNSDVLSQVFQSIFLVQNLMLLFSERYGYTEVQYRLEKDILKVSSDIIYDVSK
jgi:fructoselysine-6-P-deglycase FrlB-like protein